MWRSELRSEKNCVWTAEMQRAFSLRWKCSKKSEKELVPDYSGKKVIVIGGGNVAMDCARTSVRAGAEEVTIVYRRRKDDMTALDTEIEGAVMEGVELMTLMAPDRIEKDGEGKCRGLWVRPQMIGPYRSGRPAPQDNGEDPVLLECDIVLIAVGQDIESAPFEEAGMPVEGRRFVADGHLCCEGNGRRVFRRRLCNRTGYGNQSDRRRKSGWRAISTVISATLIHLSARRSVRLPVRITENRWDVSISQSGKRASGSMILNMWKSRSAWRRRNRRLRAVCAVTTSDTASLSMKRIRSTAGSINKKMYRKAAYHPYFCCFAY